jgi:ribonuclease-3
MNNIKNTLIKKEEIEYLINSYINKYDECLKNKDTYSSKKHLKTEIKINNIFNLQRAFFHKDFRNIQYDNDPEDTFSAMYIPEYLLSNYERIEFFGDRVIELSIVEYIYFNFPDMDEGELTKLKARLVSKTALANFADKLGFKKFMMLSTHSERIGSRDSVRFLEDMFESFMGMLFIDQCEDFNICKKFVIGVLIEHTDFNDIINNDIDHKSALLRYFHSKKYGNPIYINMYYQGNTFNREFTTLVFIPKSVYIYDPKIIPGKRQKEILDIIRKDTSIIGDNACVFTKHYTGYKNLIDMMKTDELIGLGKGSTKKVSEQNCSLDCLSTLKV